MIKTQIIQRGFIGLRKICVAFLFLCSISANAQQLQVGTATTDITPALPVALIGQFHLRIADSVESPLLVNVLVMESREGEKTLQTSVFAACDLTVIPQSLIDSVRSEVGKKLPGFNVNSIIITATHTHTAPPLGNGNLKYRIPPHVTQIDTYHALVTKRVSEAIEKAWKTRQPASVSWGLSHAVVGFNRRSVYADGTASLYGATQVPTYRTPEGPEDHDVNSLFFWNKKGKLLCVAASVACPAQEVENQSHVNADFWHEARLAIKKRLGADVCVVGWVSAAGDQSPHVMFHKAAETRMNKLANRNNLQDIGRKIGVAVQDAYDIVKNDKHENVPLVHKMDTLLLPYRKISGPEYESGKREAEKMKAQIAADSSRFDEIHAGLLWFEDALKRFENQYTNPKFWTEIHAVRIGDVAICTNQFEMFTEYGLRIQGRSKALQTFVVQLAGASNYLSTERAVKGGGYSVIMQSSLVGPEGGDIMVERTLSLTNGLFPEKK